MPRYEKYCPICGSPFLADRIGATYCQKKCRNRAAKINPEMLDILLKAANSRTRTLETMPKVVREYLKRENNIAEQVGVGRNSSNIINNSFPGFKNRTDAITVLKEAEQLKEQRDKEQLDKQFEQEDKEQAGDIKKTEKVKINIQGNELEVEIDPEMKDFNQNLDKIKNSMKPIGDYDISGNAKYINTEEFPVSSKNGSKIRRLGE